MPKLIGVLAGAMLLFVSSLAADDLVLSGATVYPSPEAQPIRDAAVVVRDGRIVSVGARDATRVSDGARLVDCAGKTIVAGFWNCHVHILSPKLLQAKTRPADELSAQLDAMFNRWGFTRVFDLGSSLENTLALRSRIESGELRGPRILTVGEPLWTKPPIYVRDFLHTHHITVVDVKDAADVPRRVDALAADGVDGVKVFTGSMQKGAVDVMAEPMVRLAAEAAHRLRRPVFAHPQNSAGLEAAIRGGVDILAHATADSVPWTPELVARLRSHGMALVPTLTLFDTEGRTIGFAPAAFEQWLNNVIAQLRAFSAAGGEVLFGTDVGYTEHYDTGLEFKLMSRAGLDFRRILTSLTTAPAARFGSARETGRVVPGMNADLVVLDGDPAQDIAVLSRVAMTLRGGQVIYERPAPAPAPQVP